MLSEARFNTPSAEDESSRVERSGAERLDRRILWGYITSAADGGRAGERLGGGARRGRI